MRGEKWFEKMLDSVKESIEFQLETIILHLTEQVCKKMKDEHITRTQLAEKLEVSSAAVSKILNGNPNFTIRTLLLLADALNLKLEINFVDNAATAQAQAQMQAKSPIVATSTDFIPGFNLATGATSSSFSRPTRPSELQIS